MNVNGNELFRDLRSGMADEALMKKYRMTGNELQAILGKINASIEVQYAKTVNITGARTGLETYFRKIALKASELAGSPISFIITVVFLILWSALGPFLNYSDTWLLLVNTLGNTSVFLIVFLIQNTQNRHAKAVQLKLNELVRAVEGARTEMVALETLPDRELKNIESEFVALTKTTVVSESQSSD